MKLVLASLAALAVACGGGKKSDTGPTPAGGSDAAAAAGDAGAGATGPNAAAGPPSEAECDALLDHLFAIRVEAMEAELPPEQVPTDEQIREKRDAMRPEFLSFCLTMTRERYACAFAATTREAMEACDQIP